MTSYFRIWQGKEGLRHGGPGVVAAQSRYVETEVQVLPKSTCSDFNMEVDITRSDDADVQPSFSVMVSKTEKGRETAELLDAKIAKIIPRVNFDYSRNMASKLSSGV